jgi:hypothetical protein
MDEHHGNDLNELRTHQVSVAKSVAALKPGRGLAPLIGRRPIMANVAHAPLRGLRGRDVRAHLKTPAGQAFEALHIGFVVAPLIAGLDKFADLLTNWDGYLAPQLANIVGRHQFMMAAGVIEIIAAFIVALKPKIGGYIVAAWLLGIFGNLLLLGNYYDVALRDLGLAIGAFALAQLATGMEITDAVRDRDVALR